MFEARADTDLDVLYLTLTGSMDEAEIAAAADETVRQADRFDGEFAVVTDLSAFDPPSPDAAKPISAAQAELRDRGLARAVHVAPERDGAVAAGFERRSREAGHEAETAATVSAAEQLLGY
jgi:hypothetical protein